jgi:glucose/mannose-6-phosphate isomerase
MAFEKEYEAVKATIQKYPQQLKQSWEDVRSIDVPNSYKNVKNIVFCGMGGSALGARMIDSLCFGQLSIPLEVFNEYHLPRYVNDDTLVVISSYSGTTEETLSDLHDKALAKGAKVFGITTGGSLATELQEKKIPSYIFEPINNPSGQPRMGIGYSAGAFLALLSMLGLIDLKEDDIYSAISAMQEASKHYASETDVENTAYNLSQKLVGKMPILVSSEHLVGTIHTIKNQFNESAKTFASSFDLPELNHHLLEGLDHPKTNKDNLHFVFFNSHLYTDRIQKRYPITQEVLTKNGIEHTSFAPTSTNKLTQVFESLVFGSFVVYYLTKSYEIDPLAIPWVDYFKKALNDK